MDKLKGSKRNRRSNKNKKINKTNNFRKKDIRTTRKKKISGGMHPMYFINLLVVLLFIHCVIVGELKNPQKTIESVNREYTPYTEQELIPLIKKETHLAAYKLFQEHIPQQFTIKSQLEDIIGDDSIGLNEELLKIGNQNPEYKKYPQESIIKNELKNIAKIISLSYTSNKLSSFITNHKENVIGIISEANILLQEIGINIRTIFSAKEKKSILNEEIDEALQKAREKDIRKAELIKLSMNVFEYTRVILPLLPSLGIQLPKTLNYGLRSIAFINKSIPPSKTKTEILEETKDLITINKSLNSYIKEALKISIDLIDSKIESDILVISMEASKQSLEYLLLNVAPAVAEYAIQGLDILRFILGIL